MTRFEKYVRARLAEATAEKRARLEKAVEDAKAELDAKCDRLVKLILRNVAPIDAKFRAAAAKDGLHVVGPTDAGEKTLADEFGCRVTGWVRGMVEEFRTESGWRRAPDGSSKWVEEAAEGTPVRAAQKALEEFDKNIEDEATKLVVYKMDLGWKPEKFESYLADLVGRLNK